MSTESNPKKSSMTKEEICHFAQISLAAIGVVFVVLMALYQNELSRRSSMVVLYQSDVPSLLARGADGAHSCNELVGLLTKKGLMNDSNVGEPLQQLDGRCKALELNLADLRSLSREYYGSDFAKNIEDTKLVGPDEFEAQRVKTANGFNNVKASLIEIDKSASDITVGQMKYEIAKLPPQNLVDDRISIRIENFQRAAANHSGYGVRNAYESLNSSYEKIYGTKLPKYHNLSSVLR